MPNIIHLIPYHAIGGVERAAQSMIGDTDKENSFSVATILPHGVAVSPITLWNPFYYLETVWRMWRARPTVLVVSLWRAYAIGVIIKIFRPCTHLVVFLHYPKSVHILDGILTCLAVHLATCVWGDSQQTLRQRQPNLAMGKGRVISFVTERISPVARATLAQPTFIFWGRIHPQKGLQRAVRIFAGIHSRCPDARFVIIGPDGGALTSIIHQVMEMGLDQVVLFKGGMGFSDIRNEAAAAAFYLQTSELEGMAMSVVEAMQLGLVPVVTPVGEIAHYARQGVNSIIVHDDVQAMEDVLELLRDTRRYDFIRSNAIATWQYRPLYKEDVVKACRGILSQLK